MGRLLAWYMMSTMMSSRMFFCFMNCSFMRRDTAPVLVFSPNRGDVVCRFEISAGCPLMVTSASRPEDVVNEYRTPPRRGVGSPIYCP